MLPQSLRSAVEKILSDRILSNKLVSGGSINHAFKLETTSRNYFLKFNVEKKYPRMFEAEAMGLSLLRNTKTLIIPDVVATGEASGNSFLILEWIEPGKRKRSFWKDFGNQLAQLHKNTTTNFGLDHDNYIGSLAQSNRQHSSWIDFFIEERIGQQIELASDSGNINSAMVNQFEKLFLKLPGIFPEEKPSLLHGDLWSGNFMVTADGSPALIDPAVYYGHREMDLAMAKLFGGFDPEFYDSYRVSFPLSAGFESRVDIYNLYPLLVHVNLFGGGYVQQVKSILSRF
jgi:protein-ribulosamine 3-kinase